MRSELHNSLLESNLIFYFHDRLQPALVWQQQIDSNHPATARYACLSVIESFLWLHLGVRVGYFPLALSRRMTYEYFGAFLKAYEVILATKFIDTWMSQTSIQILRGEFEGRAPLFSVSPSSVPQSPNLAANFQAVFLLSNEFAERPEAQAVVKAISLLPEVRFEEIMSHYDSYVLDPKAAFVDFGERSLWFRPGFFQILEYLRAIPHLHGDAISVSCSWGVREQGAVDDIFSDMKSIQQWRLNFGYPMPREAFLRLAAQVGHSLFRFTVEEDVRNAIQRYEKEVLELLVYWGAPESMSAGQKDA